MIENKQDGWNAKRKARDKANHRFIKNQHWIAPSVIAVALLYCLLGATIAMSISTSLIAEGALAGMWVGLLVCLPFIIKGLRE